VAHGVGSKDVDNRYKCWVERVPIRPSGFALGMEAIPKRWLKRMDRDVVTEIDRLAVKLIDLSPLVRDATAVMAD